MTQNRMLIVPAACALTLVLSLSAGAQPTHISRGGGDGGPRPRGPEALFELLELSETQQEEWTLLHQDQREASRVLMKEMSSFRALIKEELDSGAPDATTVGEAMISSHQLDEEGRGLKEQLQQDTATLLDDEQLARYEAFMASREGGRRGGPRGGGGGRGHRGPGGGGEEK